MKNLLLLLLVLILALPSVSVNAQVEFQKSFIGPDSAGSYYIQQTNDNGYIITGQAINFIAGYGVDAYLVKIDSNGNLQWSKTYGSIDNEKAMCVQQTNDGGYIICGNIMHSTSSDGFLIKTNANGDTIWTKTYINEYLSSVRQTSNGGYIICGQGFISYAHTALINKVDNNGNIL